MKTIVEYSSTEKALNAYPKRIISPSHPQSCCAVHMEHVGPLQRDERGSAFHYRRCRMCGFAVRHFLPVELPEYVPVIGPRAQWLLPHEQVA